MSVAARTASFWQRYDIRQIEDLQNAVLGAELEVIQMAGPRVGGSLAFAARNGIVYSSGSIDGKVAIRGSLSRDALTIGIALEVGAGSRHWLNEIQEGDVGVFLPGGEHDAIYSAGSLYVAATLTTQRLEEEAARKGVPLQREMLAKTGLHARPIALSELLWIRSQLSQIHAASDTKSHGRDELSEAVLRVILAHYSRFPQIGDGRIAPQGRACIVRRALEYIRENLAQPIPMEVLVRETGTPRRSLYRAFLEVLEDTPQGFIRRLRLHRIRHELVLGAGTVCGISAIARGWGVGADLGRMATRYQSFFGERPSATLAAHRDRLKSGQWL
ncbi:MAG: helix-turn-helix domain-containing protein [Parvibaculaceae bacterium]